ncbi:MAG: hypothetical protein ACK4R8_03380 [Thiobacillus sp.]
MGMTNVPNANDIRVPSFMEAAAREDAAMTNTGDACLAVFKIFFSGKNEQGFRACASFGQQGRKWVGDISAGRYS